MSEEQMDKLEKIKFDYVLDNTSIKLFDNLTIIIDNESDLGILVNDNYDVIDICKASELTDNYLKNRFVKDKLIYPFDSYKVDDIINISNSEDVVNRITNRVVYENDYDKMLAYIKFLETELDHYSKNAFHLLKIGCNVPHFSEYLNYLIDKINKIVIGDLRLHYVPNYLKISYSLGQEEFRMEYMSYFRNMIELYVKNMGFKINYNKDIDKPNELEYLDDEERISIKEIADQILKDHKDKEIGKGPIFAVSPKKDKISFK